MSHVFPNFTARSRPSVQAFRMALSVHPKRSAASSAVSFRASDLLPMIPDSTVSVPGSELARSSSCAAAALSAESTPIVSALSLPPPPFPDTDWDSPRTIRRRMGSATDPGTTTVPSGRIRWANCTSFRDAVTTAYCPAQHPRASQRSSACTRLASATAGLTDRCASERNRQDQGVHGPRTIEGWCL